MNLKKIMVMAGAAVLLSGLPILAGAKTSPEMGKKLFTTPGLGGSANGKSCHGCHPNGEKIGKAGKKERSKKINRCLTDAMGGSKIDGRSAEMKSLKLYIESLPLK